MVVDGKCIARALQSQLTQQVRGLVRRPKLGVIVVHETPQIKAFVALKQRFGAAIGIVVDVVRMPPIARGNEELLRLILKSTRTHDGLIVQLPLPKEYDVDEMFGLFPLSHDVDVLGAMAYRQYEEGALPFMPPVVAAFAEVLHASGVRLVGHTVTVLGKGRLVGAPAAKWAERFGATVTVVDESTPDVADHTRAADIVICGAGAPHFLKPDMVKEGVIVLDAGTSEQGGTLAGDADPAVAEKAAFFTPTPGGIGPITVAKVFENLLILDRLKHKKDRAHM